MKKYTEKERLLRIQAICLATLGTVNDYTRADYEDRLRFILDAVDEPMPWGEMTEEEAIAKLNEPTVQ